MKKQLIPEEKISDMRFGQLLFNAINASNPEMLWGVVERDLYVADRLFFIENDKLEKLIEEYLNKHGNINEPLADTQS